MPSDYDLCIAAGGDAESCAIFKEEEDAGVQKTTFDTFLNRELIDWKTGAIGTLKYVDRPAERKKDPETGAFTVTPARRFYYLVDRNGNQTATYEGSTFLDPINRAIIARGAGENARITTASADDLARFGFTSDGGAGSGRRSEADILAEIQERARLDAEEQRRREAFDAEQNRINREAEAAENEKARQAAERARLLGEVGETIRTRIGERTRARELGTGIAGEDIFRFLGTARGLAPSAAPTATDYLKGDLAKAAQFKEPTIEQNATIGDLDSVLKKLQAAQAPTGGGIGFETGGTFREGALRPSMGQKVGTLVGEAGSYIAPGTEVAVTAVGSPDVEIIPIKGAMEAGGTIDLTSLDPSTINLADINLGGAPQLFGGLRESMGVPAWLPTLDANPTIAPEMVRSRLGIVPTDYQAPQLSIGANPPAFQAFGAPLDITEGIRQTLVFQGRPDTEALQQAQALSARIGLLPAPHRISPRFFAALLPTEKQALVSAYRLAGVPEADFTHLLAAPVLAGSASGRLSAVA